MVGAQQPTVNVVFGVEPSGLGEFPSPFPGIQVIASLNDFNPVPES